MNTKHLIKIKTIIKRLNQSLYQINIKMLVYSKSNNNNNNNRL